MRQDTISPNSPFYERAKGSNTEYRNEPRSLKPEKVWIHPEPQACVTLEKVHLLRLNFLILLVIIYNIYTEIIFQLFQTRPSTQELLVYQEISFLSVASQGSPVYIYKRVEKNSALVSP